jgi:uncharacterized protein YeaO (DUF488 family)
MDATEPKFTVARVYDESGIPQGAYRVLVDRLWPRGVAKADHAWDEWLKDVAPSTELRRWYQHDQARFGEFEDRYRAELTQDPAAGAVAHLRTLAESQPVVLLTATKDVDHSEARVLADYLNLDHR